MDVETRTKKAFLRFDLTIETPMCLRLGTHGADEKPHIVCCLC